MLSYSAYDRHLSPLVCSVSIPQSPSVSSHLVGEDREQRDMQDESSASIDRDMASDDGGEHSDDDAAAGDAEASDTATSDEEDTEVMNKDEECGYESIIGCSTEISQPLRVSNDPTQQSDDAQAQPNTLAIIQYICYIVSFFQLCYKLSDRAITLLLVFFAWAYVLD